MGSIERFSKSVRHTDASSGPDVTWEELARFLKVFDEQRGTFSFLDLTNACLRYEPSALNELPPEQASRIMEARMNALNTILNRKVE